MLKHSKYCFKYFDLLWNSLSFWFQMAVEMLSVDKTGSVESEMSSRPIPDSSLALPPSRPESQEGKNSSPAFSSNLPSSSSTGSFLAPTSSSSLPPTLLQSDSSLTDLKPDQSSSNLEEKKEEHTLWQLTTSPILPTFQKSLSCEKHL